MVDNRADVGRPGKEWSCRIWKHYKQGPVSNQKQRGYDDLAAERELHDQVTKEIGDRDLRQDIGELKERVPSLDRQQDLAHQEKS